ncbi:MAG: hypothetical protein ACI83B_003403, partial [Sediminicola sp.]
LRVKFKVRSAFEFSIEKSPFTKKALHCHFELYTPYN